MEIPPQASLHLMLGPSAHLVHLGLTLCWDLQAPAPPLAGQCVPCTVSPSTHLLKLPPPPNVLAKVWVALQGMKSLWNFIPPIKLPFKSEDKMKIFSEKQKWKVLVTDRD